MKFATIEIKENNSVGIGFTEDGTAVLNFKCPNEPYEANPKMVDVHTTSEEITTFLKLTPKALEALTVLLNDKNHGSPHEH